MKLQHHTSMGRLALGAILLLLAIAASSCGTALPTAPSVETAAAVHRASGAGTLQDSMSPEQVGDGTNPAAGPDLTNMPPAGEEIVPTPGSSYNGTKTGWWNNVHRRHNK